jgi:hypothetical protein
MRENRRAAGDARHGGERPWTGTIVPMRLRANSLKTEIQSRNGEVIRQFDVVSAATVLTAYIGGVFLVFFAAAFLPWLLSKGMTAAVEGIMSQLGFGSFHATTIWSWILVLVTFALFTAFIVAIATGILLLYNLVSEHTGRRIRVGSSPRELLSGAQDGAAAEVPADATFDELYAEAQRLNLRGRSRMTKDQLHGALRQASRNSDS